MNEEERNAIEYLKTRLYGNEGCKYIDVAQEDLRIFINLVDRKEKDIEGWKKHCEEIEEEQTEMSNKNCELEFEVEKLQKENELAKKQVEYDKTHICTPQIIKLNYIPIQKIKDKIEELYQQDKNWSEEMSEPDSNFKNIDRNLKRIKNQIDVLQELIEESEEK